MVREIPLTVNGLEPVWSPDRSRILFTGWIDSDSEIYSISADGSDLVQLTDNDVEDLEGNRSPEGERIVFVSDRGSPSEREGDSNFDLYTMTADGGEVVRLTDHPAHDFAPSWSPDANLIVFVSLRTESPDLYVVTADGSQLRRAEILDTLQNAGRWVLIRGNFNLRNSEGAFLFEAEPA